jgi:glycerol-3-phosphate dehydrogenase
LITITGGKLTTYRKMAEDTVDAAVKRLGHKVKRSQTSKLKLHGAEDGPAPKGATSHLVGRYGSDARAVLQLVADDPSLGEPLVPGLPYLRAEAVYAVREEMARTLEDVLSRRTRALLLERDATEAAAPDVAELIGRDLGWDEAERRRQVEEFSRLVDRERHAAQTSPPEPAQTTG